MQVKKWIRKQNRNVLDGMKGIIVLGTGAIERKQKQDANKDESQECEGRV